MATDQQKEVNENFDTISNQDEEPGEFATPTIEELRLQGISVFQQRKSTDLTVSSHQKNFEAELDELRKVFNEVEYIVTSAVTRRHLFSDIMRKTFFLIVNHQRKLKLISLVLVWKSFALILVDQAGRGIHYYDTTIFRLLQGTERSLVFIHDMHHMQEKTFFKFGQLVALAFLSGCDTPHHLSETLVCHMLGMIDIFLK